MNHDTDLERALSRMSVHDYAVWRGAMDRASVRTNDIGDIFTESIKAGRRGYYYDDSVHIGTADHPGAVYYMGNRVNLYALRQRERWHQGWIAIGVHHAVSRGHDPGLLKKAQPAAPESYGSRAHWTGVPTQPPA